jgi:hypothetical protein
MLALGRHLLLPASMQLSRSRPPPAPCRRLAAPRWQRPVQDLLTRLLSPPTLGTGNLTSSKDLAKKLERVKPYLTGHGTTGGITISGGEPLLQVPRRCWDCWDVSNTNWLLLRRRSNCSLGVVSVQMRQHAQ